MISIIKEKTVGSLSKEDRRKFMTLYKACMDSLSQLRDFAQQVLTADAVSDINAAAIMLRNIQKSIEK